MMVMMIWWLWLWFDYNDNDDDDGDDGDDDDEDDDNDNDDDVGLWCKMICYTIVQNNVYIHVSTTHTEHFDSHIGEVFWMVRFNFHSLFTTF